MQTQKNRTHTTKKIGFYDTLTTSVLLNRCGIISGGNFIIIKLENEDGDIQARLWIAETLLQRHCFGEHRGGWRGIIVTWLEQHSHDLRRLSCAPYMWRSVEQHSRHSVRIVTQLSTFLSHRHSFVTPTYGGHHDSGHSFCGGAPLAYCDSGHPFPRVFAQTEP